MKPLAFFASAALALVIAQPTMADLEWCNDPPSPAAIWLRCIIVDRDLSGANLYYADLSDTQIIRVNLTGANLEGATYYTARLTEVNLSHANLSYADLNGATLDEVNLTGANLGAADLNVVNLTGAILDHATWPDGRICAVGSRGVCN